MAHIEQEGSSSNNVTTIDKFFILDDKVVNFDKLFELSPFNLKDYYEACGWTPYFDMVDDIHIDEWRQFFENNRISVQDVSVFKTTVNEKEIKKECGCKREGVTMYNSDWLQQNPLSRSGEPVTEAYIVQKIYEDEDHQSSKQESCNCSTTTYFCQSLTQELS